MRRKYYTIARSPFGELTTRYLPALYLIESVGHVNIRKAICLKRKLTDITFAIFAYKFCSSHRHIIVIFDCKVNTFSRLNNYIRMNVNLNSATL